MAMECHGVPVTVQASRGGIGGDEAPPGSGRCRRLVAAVPASLSVVTMSRPAPPRELDGVVVGASRACVNPAEQAATVAPSRRRACVVRRHRQELQDGERLDREVAPLGLLDRLDGRARFSSGSSAPSSC
jgi:hypothetical protein